MRIAERSERSPNRSSHAAAKYSPPVTPPKKKYRTIHHDQWGIWKFGSKSGGIGATPGCVLSVHAVFTYCQHARDTSQDGGDQAQATAGGQVAARQVWRLGQAVRRRGVLNEEKRIQAAQEGFVVAVEFCLGTTGLLQLLHALRSVRAQLVNGAELDGSRGARLGAGRREA